MTATSDSETITWMTGALSQISQFLFVLQNKVGDLMSKATKLTL